MQIESLSPSTMNPGSWSSGRLAPRFPDDEPRQHYYQFAHRVLPGILFRSTEPFRAAALAGRADVGLQKLWGDVDPVEADSDAPLTVRASVHECPGRAVVLVTPPRAEHITEAHYIAIVLDHVDPSFVRYIVLEHSWDTQSQPRTTLGEWLRDGSHVNFGDGPEPTEAAFLDIVCERFTGPPPS
jgi:hypothetical protein